MKCFHHVDLDGYASGHLISVFESNRNQKDFYGVNYEDTLPLDKIEKDELVYFVDYSFSVNTASVLDEILKITKNVVWIDHHKSSIELLEQRPDFRRIKGLVDIRHSGAANTYMYLYKCEFDKVPKYIQYVSDYDCWHFHMLDTMAFKYGMDMLHQKPFDDVWTILMNDFHESYLLELISKGKIIEEYVKIEKERYCDSYSYKIDIDGYSCLVCNRRDNSTIFGNRINDYDLVMVWVYDGSGYEYSIYTTKSDVDCSKIAEKFGGGGHKNASGFRSKDYLF